MCPTLLWETTPCHHRFPARFPFPGLPPELWSYSLHTFFRKNSDFFHHKAPVETVSLPAHAFLDERINEIARPMWTRTRRVEGVLSTTTQKCFKDITERVPSSASVHGSAFIISPVQRP